MGVHRHRPRGERGEPRPARGRHRHRLDSAGAGGRVRGDGGPRHRPSAHLARRPHHLARPAGGRRHDHHREHGQPPGARRRQAAGRRLRLRLHRLSAAHRHAGHHRGVRARRLRAQRRRRVHLLAVRRRGPGAAGLLGGLRPLCTGRRPGAAAPAEASAWRDAGCADAPVPALPAGGDAGQVDHHRGHGCSVRGRSCRDPFRAGAVLSRLRPPRAPGGPEAAGQCLDPGHARRCRGVRPNARCRPGCRAFLHLCRSGRHPLLSADRRRAAQRLLRPVGRGDEGAQGARAGARAS